MNIPKDSDSTAGVAAPPLFRPLGRKKAYEEVSDEIRKLIHIQRLQASHRLPTERDLAEQFGVSRMVVREAIRTLERSGLLAVKKGPRGGIFVVQEYNRPISDTIGNLLAGGDASLANLLEVRLLIEPYAASRAAEFATDADIAQLSEVISESQLAADRCQMSLLRTQNIEFHRVILRISRNPVLSVMGEAVLVILSDRLKNSVPSSHSATMLESHLEIFEAIRKRQTVKARTLMEKDIQLNGRHLAELSPEVQQQLAANEGLGD